MQAPWLHLADPTIAFLPMMWFVGQHVERLSMDLADKPGASRGNVHWKQWMINEHDK